MLYNVQMKNTLSPNHHVCMVTNLNLSYKQATDLPSRAIYKQLIAFNLIQHASINFNKHCVAAIAYRCIHSIQISSLSRLRWKVNIYT